MKTKASHSNLWGLSFSIHRMGVTASGSPAVVRISDDRGNAHDLDPY